MRWASPGVTSVYTWQGRVETADEHLLVIKSTAHLFDDICARVRSEHPYDTPEVVALPVHAIDARYAAWLAASVRDAGHTGPAGIVRAGSAYMPLDEALAFAAVDLSGRPYTVVDMRLLGKEVGGMKPDLLDHFLESFANTAKMNLHVKTLAGANDHHKAEACFKALARALDAACRVDPRRGGDVPSTKGTI